MFLRKPGREVAEGQRGVQLVQREVGGGKPLLPKFAAEYVNRIIAARRSFGKTQVRQRNERASRTPAEGSSRIRNAALRRGFFSSAISTACCRVSGEGFAAALSRADYRSASERVSPICNTAFSTSHSRSLRRLHPRRLVFNDFVRGMEAGGFLHHGSHGTIFFLRKANSFLQRFFVDIKAGDNVMNSDDREYLGRTFRLIGLDPHLVSGDLLVILLAQHGDHIESGAAGQTGGDEFNRLRPGPAGSIVQQQVMAAAGLGYKLHVAI